MEGIKGGREFGRDGGSEKIQIRTRKGLSQAIIESKHIIRKPSKVGHLH